MKRIDNLKKITLSIEAGTSQETMDCPVKCPQLSFIFGLGPEGMTPFEYELIDRSEGDIVLLHLKKEEFCRFFEHLDPPLTDLFDKHAEIYLKMTIVSVASAEPRDIVKSMAAIASRGESSDSCGCGCGCGC